MVHPHPLYDHFGALADPETSRRKLNVPEGKKVLLFFGFIREYKGLDILLQALAQLDERYVLLIGGEVYGDFSSYEEQIRSLGLDIELERS